MPKDPSGSSGAYGDNLDFSKNCLQFQNSFGSGVGGIGNNNSIGINNTATATATFNTDSNNLPYCAFTVNESCDNLKFTDGLFGFFDKNNELINSANNISRNFRSVTEGITFSCGTNDSINYNYEGFDVELINSCFNQDQSFLVFTPKSGTTGTYGLGFSVNADNSQNVGLNITNINNQNGQFYFNPICDIDSNSKDILVSVLNDVVIS